MTGRLVRRVLTRLFPAGGRHRAAAPPQPAPDPAPRRRRLPRHKSPYAQDAATGGPFLDTPLRPVRPYLPTPYVSPACHIGTHATCDKGAPEPEVISVPGVRWEACSCPCHARVPTSLRLAAGAAPT
ncbi:hypothetical protein ADL29_05770 [Streptomyces chattanoogensis]|uniref:Uncharacterized protein n=1 Tax=Streptomyces chattanoogensis TaxID=66876 RepID=A0A0N0Y0S3_9ACTN|nr:hypothetical protein ADL29_05770 [Streptomyces chattanoogensis]